MSIIGKGRRYDQEYKDMIVDLFKSGMSLAELSSEYGLVKSTINGWIKDVKETKSRSWGELWWYSKERKFCEE